MRKMGENNTPFDIWKNEQSKAWFRKKKKDDEDNIKKENKLKKLLSKEKLNEIKNLGKKNGNTADESKTPAPKEETKDSGPKKKNAGKDDEIY